MTFWHGACQAETEDAPRFKLTGGLYQVAGKTEGVDLNLRYGSDIGNLWLGRFENRDPHDVQWRVGWDTTTGTDVRVAPSLQVASGGFVGGSVAVETGQPFFAGAGIGRTNLRPYWNLNFDPNDSYSLTAGYRAEGGSALTLLYVRDNRENPDQRHLHLLWRQPLAEGQRLTVDLLHKEGKVEDGAIRRWGLGATYDWPAFFVRLTFDPNVNFTPDDMWRFALGLRF